jgi:hypothetical protein
MTISFCDTTAAKDLAGQPTFNATKLATYAAFINAFVGQSIGEEFAATDAGNAHEDFLDGGSNYVKTRNSPIVTLTKIELVDSGYVVQSMIDARFYIQRNGSGIIEARANLPEYGTAYPRYPGRFPEGQANLKVSYLSGYGPSSEHFKQASLGATYLLASMILQDVASAQDTTLGAVQSWTIESISKTYGSSGAYGAQITRFWTMGKQIIDGIAGGSELQII